MTPSVWQLGLPLVLALVGLYFVPSMVALFRGAKAGGVFVVNLLVGWTVVGWLVAFVWACTGKSQAERDREDKRHAEVLAALGHSKANVGAAEFVRQAKLGGNNAQR